MSIPEFAVLDRDGSLSPVFLETTLGSLSEERRTSRTRNYKKLNKLIGKTYRRFGSKLQMSNLISQPESFNIKLSELVAWCPSHQLSCELRWNIQTKVRSNTRLLRSLLVFCINSEIDFTENYYLWTFFEELKAYCATFQEREGQVSKEIFSIYRLLIGLQDLSLCKDFLGKVYSESNIRVWSKTGENLFLGLSFFHISYINVKEKVRRRGYHETHSNKNKSKDQRGEVQMSQESRDLEQIKESIKIKQALVFEKQLDLILQSYDQDIEPEVLRQRWIELTKQKTEIVKVNTLTHKVEEGGTLDD